MGPRPNEAHPQQQCLYTNKMATGKTHMKLTSHEFTNYFSCEFHIDSICMKFMCKNTCEMQVKKLFTLNMNFAWTFSCEFHFAAHFT